MGDSHKIADISELVALENSCNSFSVQLDALAGRFKSETDALAAAWNDNMYLVLRSRVEPIFMECSKALSVVTDNLIPFINRKRIWAEGRPNSGV